MRKPSKLRVEKVWAQLTNLRDQLSHQIVDLHVGHHVHLHVGHHFSHHARYHNVVSTLCEVSEALTEWKFESITDLRTD